MNNNEIQKAKRTYKIGSALSLLCVLLMMMLVFRGNIKGAGFFLAIEAICVLITSKTSYTFYKKTYIDNVDSFKVPKIYRNGETINPNHPKGYKVWKGIFIFVVVGLFLGIALLVLGE
ncbi:hypothetical protein [Lactococcus petauri]|jgi:hypothetical protein|uniref:hypothetical protein n=1 Tax=Lactococcus petauri TaxID=1940789 RepID=UPI0013FD2CAD|nr:hypothetical protein [Lactococcus petauri]NHI76896.1 hypothetical protein [Lactococcus petauri]